MLYRLERIGRRQLRIRKTTYFVVSYSAGRCKISIKRVKT